MSAQPFCSLQHPDECLEESNIIHGCNNGDDPYVSSQGLEGGGWWWETCHMVNWSSESVQLSCCVKCRELFEDTCHKLKQGSYKRTRWRNSSDFRNLHCYGTLGDERYLLDEEFEATQILGKINITGQAYDVFIHTFGSNVAAVSIIWFLSKAKREQTTGNKVFNYSLCALLDSVFAISVIGC